MQDDRFGAAGTRDRAIGVAAIDKVGGIGSRPEGRRSRHELERTAATEAVPDAVGFRSHLPAILEEAAAGLLGDAMPVKTGNDAQFGPRPEAAARAFGDRTAGRRGGAFAHRQDIARLEL